MEVWDVYFFFLYSNIRHSGQVRFLIPSPWFSRRSDPLWFSHTSFSLSLRLSLALHYTISAVTTEFIPPDITSALALVASVGTILPRDFVPEVCQQDYAG